MTADSAPRRMYTIRELAEATHTSPAYWTVKIHADAVKIVRYGKAIRIPAEEYERLLTEGC